MAEDDVGGGVGTLGRTYRLSAPDRRAFDPTQLELLTQTQIAQPDGGQLLGYNMLARTRAANAQEDYMAGVQQTNAAQARGAAQQQAGDLTRAILSARDPGLAYRLALTRQVIAPDSMDFFRERSDIGQAGAEADVNNTNAQANQRNADAGVLPPPGSPFSRYSMPLEVRRQGTPPAMLRGSGSGEPSIRDELALERLLQGIQNNVPVATQAHVRAALAAQGLQAQMDMNGQVIRPAGMPEATYNAIVSDARMRAERDAQQRSAGVQQRLGRRFGDRDMSAGIPQGEAPQMQGQPQPRVITPPNVAPQGGGAAPNVAPVAPVQTPQQPSVNQITPDRVQAIQRQQPPGTARIEHNRRTGVTTYYDGQGNALGTVRQ